jgi:hypothetical protein
MPNATDTYIQQNETRFLNELKDFIRIPSISTLPENKPDIDRAAQFVTDALKKAGLENVEIIPTQKHPLVYADWLHAPENRLFSATATTMSSRPIRSNCGKRLRLNRPSGMATSTPADRPTTRGKCTCTLRPSKRYLP